MSYYCSTPQYTSFKSQILRNVMLQSTLPWWSQQLGYCPSPFSFDTTQFLLSVSEFLAFRLIFFCIPLGNLKTWSWWSELNRHSQLGRLKFYHWITPTYNNWLGYLDSNQGNNGVKVCYLTTWLHSNIDGCGRVRTCNHLSLFYVRTRLYHLSYTPILARNDKPLPTEYKALRYTQRIRTVSLIIPLSLCLTHSFDFADAYFNGWQHLPLLFVTLQTLS